MLIPSLVIFNSNAFCIGIFLSSMMDEMENDLYRYTGRYKFGLEIELRSGY